MSILVPGVNHRLLPGKSTAALDPRFITIHTMVWGLAPCEDYFRRAGNPYSHFGTGHDGEIRQWQDLQYRAASCYKANPYSISIENADKGVGFPTWSGSDVPRFTDAQAESLVVLLSWLCHRFGLPKVAIATSCPHERGIGYHRLGVDPWRNTSCGLLMSSSPGKVCPGDRRIAQLRSEIIPAVSAPAAPDPDLEDPVVNDIYILHCTLLGADINPRLWSIAERRSLNHYCWLANTDPNGAGSAEEIRKSIQATAKSKGLI